MIPKKYMWLLRLLALTMIVGTTNAQVPGNKPVSSGQTPAPTVSVNVLQGAYPTTLKLNFVRTKEAMGPISSESSFNSADYLHVKETTLYFDGLGRPLQTVNRQMTPSGKDLVAPVVYDAFGREIFKYLPYAQTTGTNMNDGKFKLNPFADQSAFYQNSTQNPGIVGEQIFYGKTDFETSPLNRIEKAMAPGNSWAGSDRGISSKYLVNTTADSVRIWIIANDALTFINADETTNIPTSAMMYGAGELYKNVSIDEDNNITVQYKDKEGHVILNKSQVGTIASDYSGHTGFLCTYYVYDDFGQLRFVMQPKAVNQMLETQWQLETDVIRELCFRYEYDERNRLIAKKVPGAGWVYSVYDKRDRLVYEQDANMRSKNQWLATLYDGLNRPVMTGMITFNGDRNALQNSVNNSTGNSTETQIEVEGNSPSPVPDHLSVTNRILGQLLYQATENVSFEEEFESETNAEFVAENSVATIIPFSTTVAVLDNLISLNEDIIPLTITYYDDYSWTNKTYTSEKNFLLDPGNNLHAVPMPVTAFQIMSGSITGTKVRVLEDPNDLSIGSWLTTVNFYDDHNRVIQSQSDNYKGGTDITTNLYDFTGNVLSSLTSHTNYGAVVDINIRTDWKYDHAKRLLQLKKTVNPYVGLQNPYNSRVIANNAYDELGQLMVKDLGFEEDYEVQSLPFRRLNYSYNIRGWLTGINKNYVNTGTDDQWFGMELNYNYGFGTSQFNGNIAGTKWRSRGDGERRAYGFLYDKVNRFLSADFSQSDGTNYIDHSTINFDVQMGDGQSPFSAYDANGNILAMKQWGLKVSNSTLVDDLGYSYESNSNKLRNVSDAVNDITSKLGDFVKSGSEGLDGFDYEYDANGNLVFDYNKGLIKDSSWGEHPNLGMGVFPGISYNYLNLPVEITKRVGNSNISKGKITYIYDANGNKLEKRVFENVSSLNQFDKRTITTYLSGFQYENNQLQLIMHEEGRMRVNTTVKTPTPCPPNPCGYDAQGNPIYCPCDPLPLEPIHTVNFDYFLKDHLGNVRMVLTEEKDTARYVATMESQFRAMEERLFYKIPETEFPAANVPGGYPTETSVTNPNLLLSRLNGSGQKLGPAIVLKVMSGDVVDIGVKSFYRPQGSPGSNSNPLSDILGALASGIIGAVGESKGALSDLSNPNTSPLLGAINAFRTTNNLDVPGKPKAYLNWILLDEQFKIVSSYPSQSGALPVGDADVINTLGYGIDVRKNGYLYIYVSNETQNWDVFFDNLSVIHRTGPLVEETHYYPFGLTMAGISSKALKSEYAENKKKYNGIEKEDAFGIEIYDAQLRELDPQIGRWWQVDPKIENMEMWSPYASNFDNPVRYSDPLGDEGTECCKGFFDALVKGGKDVITFAAGAANAFTTNQVGGVGRGDPNTFGNSHDVAVAKAGQTTGDYLTIFVAASTTIGTGVLEFFTGGTASPVAIPLALQQNLVAVPTAVKNLIDDRSNIEGATDNSNVRNPHGSKGKPDHQEKVKELSDKAKGEAKPGEQVLQERQIQGQDSKRKPDVQIVNPEGKTRKVFEAERKPTHQRNTTREKEYKKLGVEQETHKVGH